MKNIKDILVPTDFSKYGDSAVNAAIQMAKRTGARLHVFHCISIPDIVVDQPTEEKLIEEFKTSIANRVKVKMENYLALAVEQGVVCSIEQSFGEFLGELEERVNQHSVDLVVMGSQGASGKKEWFIGSNTQKALRKLLVPVLVIKNQVDTLSFSKAVFVSGLNMNERATFKMFLSFLKFFDIKELHIMSVNTNVFFTQPAIVMQEALKQFEELAEGFNTKTHFYSDISIDAVVRRFIQEKKIDILGISNHMKHPIKRILQGSNVEIIVNHSDVPVLAINNVER